MKRKHIVWACGSCRTELEGIIEDGDFIAIEELSKPNPAVGCPWCGYLYGDEITTEEIAAEWDAEDGFVD